MPNYRIPNDGFKVKGVTIRVTSNYSGGFKYRIVLTKGKDRKEVLTNAIPSVPSYGKYQRNIFKLCVTEWFSLLNPQQAREFLARDNRCRKCGDCYSCVLSDYLTSLCPGSGSAPIDLISYAKVTQRLTQASEAIVQ